MMGGRLCRKIQQELIEGKKNKYLGLEYGGRVGKDCADDFGAASRQGGEQPALTLL